MANNFFVSGSIGIIVPEANCLIRISCAQPKGSRKNKLTFWREPLGLKLSEPDPVGHPCNRSVTAGFACKHQIE